MSFASLAQLVQSYESGGNYAAQNPTSTASGAYQFTNATWAQYAPQAGYSVADYPTAAAAPPAVQDAVFAQTVSQVGLQPWTCAGCDPGLTGYVASNDVSGLPILGGTSSLGTGGSIGEGYSGNGIVPVADYSPFASTETPGAIGTTPGLGSQAQTAVAAAAPLALGANTVVGIGTGLQAWLDNFVSSLTTETENFFSRAGLVLIGVVLLVIALWRITDPSGARTRTALEAIAA